MKSSMIWKACGVAAAAAGMVALCACEWGAGRDATSWSDSFNWVNFSGTYRSSGTKTVTKSSEKESRGVTTTSESSSSALTGSAFTVIQSGQNLTITDGQSGGVYSGKFSSIRSASGYENRPAATTPGMKDGVKTLEDHGLPPGGDTIIGSFEATGPGGRLVGTLQGIVYDTNTDGTGDVFGGRTLTATLVGPVKTTQIEATSTANTTINIFYPGGTGSNAQSVVDGGGSSSGSGSGGSES